MTTQTKLKWFWWQDDKEEAWLRSMAQQGWHLKDIRLLNRYVFESGTPQDMTYRLDWITTRKDYQEYLQLFHDAGWELATTYGSWQYFRTESVDGVAPEIFTENDSKIKRYQRLAIFFVIFLVIWWHPTSASIENAMRYGWLSILVFGIRLLVFLAITVNVLMLVRRIFRLRKQSLH